MRFQKASEAFQKQEFCGAGVAGNGLGLEVAVLGDSRAVAEVESGGGVIS